MREQNWKNYMEDRKSKVRARRVHALQDHRIVELIYV